MDRPGEKIEMSDRQEGSINPLGSEPSVVAIIPARLAATRLPDKPLAMLGGKTMIQRVWERARAASCLADVLIATPDRRILEVVQAFGGRAVMTSDRHRTGTDRLAEAAEGLDADIIVNIQGDEPLIDPATIERAVQPLLDDPALPMSSLMCPCPEEERDNPATVKVVTSASGDALYFSRFPIPYPRSGESGAPTMQHIGLYAYRRDFLLTFAGLAPTPLEQAESLEQLRALEHGYRIRMVGVERAPLSVDTPEDLARVGAIIEAASGN
jgi:3-deoxy-manno-octulosonate cytidylyltransferase (CMP-KDO synthetase)